MSTEENKVLVRRFFEEVFNQRRLDRADEFVAPDYLDHAAVPGQGPGLEGARAAALGEVLRRHPRSARDD
jgi:predicted SnoaL-like aldol condensation-catalyzing enzyme